MPDGTDADLTRSRGWYAVPVLFRCLAALGAMIAWTGTALAEPVEVASETPHPGVTYTTWRDDALPANIYSIELDLTSNEIDLVATAEDQRGVKPSAFAEAAGAAVVVNGDYFKPAGFVPAGAARGGAVSWSNAQDDARSGFVRFHRGVNRIEVDLSPPAEVVEELPDAADGTVGGRPMLMQGGSPVTQFDCDDQQAMPCDPAPRTAVAVSADKNRMWLIVVDGWQSGSIGMRAAELADFAQDQLGADEALMLDGGSASAMVLDGEVVSSPSDTVERPVANHIASQGGRAGRRAHPWVRVREGDRRAAHHRRAGHARRRPQQDLQRHGPVGLHVAAALGLRDGDGGHLPRGDPVPARAGLAPSATPRSR